MNNAYPGQDYYGPGHDAPVTQHVIKGTFEITIDTNDKAYIPSLDLVFDAQDALARNAVGATVMTPSGMTEYGWIKSVKFSIPQNAHPGCDRMFFNGGEV